MFYKKYTALTAIAGLSLLSMGQPVLAESDNQQLQQQIELLQKQLTQLQDQVSAQQAATKHVQAEVKATNYASPLPPGTELVTVDAKTGSMNIGGLHVKVGGFIEDATIFRSRNETSDIGSTFNGIPFAQVPSSHESEFRNSARQSRLTLLAQYGWNENTSLTAYYSADFIGVGVTSNSGESNSYVPRLREAYFTVDKTSGWHFEAGQTWSLVTGFKDGLTPRDENVPLTIDAQYVPGFNWRRVPQVRISKTFSPAFSVGVSAESPEAGFSGDNPSLDELVTTVPGTGSGGGTLNPSANYSVDVAPDVVVKAAFDPGWGHYEVYGLGRLFRTRSGVLQSDVDNHTTLGGGVGGNAILPVIPKRLDIQGSILAGRGIGQYGSGQFSDVTLDQFGAPSAVPMIQTLVGAVAHATPDLDIYAYAGLEQASKDTVNVGDDTFGYGSPLDDNSGCEIENSSLPCQGKNKDIWQLTGGLWDKVYSGNHGTVSVGLQYSYTERQLFDGVGGSPTADDNMVFASVRYYPF